MSGVPSKLASLMQIDVSYQWETRGIYMSGAGAVTPPCGALRAGAFSNLLNSTCTQGAVAAGVQAIERTSRRPLSAGLAHATAPLPHLAK